MLRMIWQAMGSRTFGLWVLVAGMPLLGVAPSALGQLSDEDIKALRQQGEREGWTFKVGHNSATDYSLDDLCGAVVPPDWRSGAPFDECAPRGRLPEAYNWCDFGVCTPIKHQGGCGSCWAFALNGSVESNIAIMDSAIVDLSEQWLVSCCGLGGCSGEWPGNAANFYLCSGQYVDYCGDYGAVLEADFPYVAWDAPCECPFPHPYCLDTWAFIGPEWGIPSVDALKQAILDHGPVTVCVYANSAFQAYDGGIFNACQDVDINHAVVLVGWDDNQGTDGVWIMRNSWGAGWGEDGYMRIEYGCSRIGYNGLYVDYAGALPTLVFDYPEGIPELISPSQPTTFRVVVSGANDGVPVPDSGELHYAVNGSSWLIEPMTQTAPNEYQAAIPPADCFDIYNWYVSAEEATQGLITDPHNAPATSYSAVVATAETILFEDHFETDQAWSVYAGAATGNWERADPQQVNYSGTITQPGDDHTADGTRCYVTGPLAGSSAGDYDVDGGPTRLTSPVFDFAGLDPIVSYWRWYHISTTWNDELVVQISNDAGSSWATVESIDDRQTWTYVEWKVSDYVTPTSQVQVRFIADDSPNDSLVEALVDDFSVTVLVCEETGCFGDLDGDNDIDLTDLAQLLANYGMTSGAEYADGDLDADGDVDLADLAALLAVYGTSCA
jgi:C1A family cysteine protease